MRRFDPSWVAQVHCHLPQIQKSIKASMEEMIDPKNSNKAYKIKKKLFQQPQDIKRSESTSTSQNWQDSLANENQHVKLCIKEHHTRNLTW